jgi:hypothetical protein
MAFRRRQWVVALSLLAALGITLGLTVASRIPFSSDILRRRVVAALADRFEAQVELAGLTLRFSPSLHAVGSGLRIRHEARTDVPPLIAVESFVVDATLSGLWRRHVAQVALTGLEIHIPARGPEPADKNERDSVSGRSPEEVTNDYVRQVVIDRVEAPDARLVVLRRDTSKPARVWAMHALTLRSVGLQTKMPFDTVLTNAVPPGEITTSGSFGPWARHDPGQTPLEGQFTFERADLSVFDGISGTLSAKGTFGGALEVIDVRGQTSVPDFMINISRHTVPLTATYHAVVNGTNGNTTLDPVDAMLAQTPITARGGVYEVTGVKGRVVRLDVKVGGGRLEDVMRLAVNTPKPPMTGRLELETTLEIPPGKRDVVDKLKLDGRFAIGNGHFTDAGVQNRINELSQRARGRHAPEAADKVTSDFAGQFLLDRGKLSLPVVTFDVPGAVVELAGSYTLRKETLDFSGNLFMDAKLSETMTGFKSWLLKVVDPLFRRGGRTTVPLKVRGTRQDPQFGLDVGRALRPRAATPSRRSAPPR